MATYSRKRKRPSYMSSPPPVPDQENTTPALQSPSARSSNASPQRPPKRQPTSQPTPAATVAPLSTLTTQPKSNPKPKPTPKATPKAKPLTQTTISLGQRTTTTCTSCGMHYARTPADTAAHARHHASWAARMTLPAPLARDPRLEREHTPRRRRRDNTQARALDDGDALLAIGADAPGAVRAFAARMVAHAEGELGAVSTQALWDVKTSTCKSGAGASRGLPTPPGSSSPLRVDDDQDHDDDGDGDAGVGSAAREHGTTVHLYVQGRTVVGVLMAEAIRQARRVEGNIGSDSGAELQLETGTRRAHVGVARIWVAGAQRGLGIGGALLDGMVRMRLPSDGEGTTGKEGVAFSAPTAAGAALARRWFGEGWMVYRDEDVV